MAQKSQDKARKVQRKSQKSQDEARKSQRKSQRKAQKVLVIDNFDSFVYILVQYLGAMGAEPQVYRNNQLTAADLDRLNPDAVLVSPGPGRPENAGISNQVVEYFSGRCPVLGVCLGHQSIGQVFGAEVVRAAQVCHGKTSEISHDQKGIFAELDSPLKATRYHSLVLDGETVPDVLEVTARTSDGLVMGVRHRELPVEGVQFHPESVLTRSGEQLLGNFLAQ